MRDEIMKAIGSRSLLRVNYGAGSRVIEPYCLGETRKGSLVVRAYQVSGASESNEGEGWKLMTVEKILELEVLPEQFANIRKEYNPDDKAMDVIHAKI